MHMQAGREIDRQMQIQTPRETDQRGVIGEDAVQLECLQGSGVHAEARAGIGTSIHTAHKSTRTQTESSTYIAQLQ